MRPAIRLPVSLLAAAAIAMPATSQRGDYANPTKAEVKSLCQPEARRAARALRCRGIRHASSVMALTLAAVMLSACSSTAEDPERMEVGRFIQNPLPYNGRTVCLHGLWKEDSPGISLVSKTPHQTSEQDIGKPVPVVAIEAFHIDPASDREIELCGVVELDPHCFGVGVPADRYPVCLPTLIEFKPLGS